MNEICLNKEEISHWINWSSEMSTHPKWNHVRSCAICAEGINQFRKTPVSLSHGDANKTKSMTNDKPLVAPVSTPNEVDGYRLVRFLGLGSSGQVWLAEELGIGRQVAIKFLNQFGLKDNRTRLLREARILSSVNHPALLRIFGSGVAENSAWLILEYCPGGSLGDRIRNGIKHSPEEAAALLVQIAAGLVLVHQKGIIHRDIKPDNILFSDDNKPRLADFGLARMDDASASLTTKGDILGTPAYISPEQVRGGKVGPTADIHALGGVLYHLLTGAAPFRAASAFQAMALAESVSPVSPLIIDPTLSVDLVNVCLKCLQKDPRDRYVSAADFADDLREFLAGAKVKARPLGLATQIVRWSAKNRLLSLSICATIVTMIAGTIISTAMAIRALAEKDAANLSTIRTENQFYNSEMRNIQYAVDQGKISLARKMLVALEPNATGRDYRGFEWYYWNRKLKPTAEEFSLGVPGVSMARLAPNGNLLLLDRNIQLHLRDSLSGLTHRLSTLDAPKMGDLDPNGHFALLTNALGQGLLLDSRSNISQPVGPMSDQPISKFLLGPDGKEAVVFPVSNKSPIFCWDLAKNQRIRESGLAPKFISTPKLDPAGKKIAFILQNMRIGILDLEKGEMLVSPALDMPSPRQISWNHEGNVLVGIGADALGNGLLARWIPGNEPLLMPFPDGKQPIQLANLYKEFISVVDLQGTIHFFNHKLLRVAHRQGSGNLPRALWNNETRVGVVDDLGGAHEFYTLSAGDLVLPKNKGILADLAWFCPDKILFTGLSNQAELRAFPFNQATPLALDGNGNIFCAADRQGRAFVARGDKVQRIDQDGKILYGATAPKAVRFLCAEGDRVLVRQPDGTVILFDAETLMNQVTLTVLAKDAALSPNADKVVLITPSGRIKIIRSTDGTELEEFDSLDSHPTAVTMSTNGTVYVGFFGGLVRAFEPGKRQTPKDFQGHITGIIALELSPDNRRLASASGPDGQIRIWDLNSGQDLMVLQASKNKIVYRLRFSPDGQKLGSTSSNSQPDIFDARP